MVLSCVPHRDGYSQFLREMIIQPGISKAKSGCSREDVTMEDHVSPTVPTLSQSSGPGFSFLSVLSL